MYLSSRVCQLGSRTRPVKNVSKGALNPIQSLSSGWKRTADRPADIAAVITRSTASRSPSPMGPCMRVVSAGSREASSGPDLNQANPTDRSMGSEHKLPKRDARLVDTCQRRRATNTRSIPAMSRCTTGDPQRGSRRPGPGPSVPDHSRSRRPTRHRGGEQMVPGRAGP